MSMQEWPSNWVMVQLTYNYGALGQRQTLHAPGAPATEALAALRADPRVSSLTIRGIDKDGEVAAPAANALAAREPSQQVRYCIDKLNEQIAPAQAVVDGVCAALEFVLPLIEALETKAAEPPPLEEYRPGRVCVLQSGGQLMTITEVLANGMCTCIWHAEDGGPRQLVGMPKASLRLKKEADSADAD